MKYYITRNNNIARVGPNYWSLHYENDEPDRYAESPFRIKSVIQLGWVEISYNELPGWAQYQFDKE